MIGAPGPGGVPARVGIADATGNRMHRPGRPRAAPAQASSNDMVLVSKRCCIAVCRSAPLLPARPPLGAVRVEGVCWVGGRTLLFRVVARGAGSTSPCGAVPSSEAALGRGIYVMSGSTESV